MVSASAALSFKKILLKKIYIFSHINLLNSFYTSRVRFSEIVISIVIHFFALQSIYARFQENLTKKKHVLITFYLLAPFSTFHGSDGQTIRPDIIYYPARESILQNSTYYTPTSKILMALKLKEKLQIRGPENIFFFFYVPR